MTKGKIFISYRREDTSGESGRLKDKLEQIFGKENIFYDVETLEAGLNFDQSIAKALSESKVLLAMIGPHWLRVTDAEGKPRIMKSQDWVRKEISLAIQKDLRVIPILVNGAKMPDSSELPEDLQEFALKHAQEISSSRWNYDVGELVKLLERIVEPKPKPPTDQERHPPRPPLPPKMPKQGWLAKNYLWLLGGVVGMMMLVGMCMPDDGEVYPIDPNQTEPLSLQEMQDIKEKNPNGTEIYDNLTLKNSPSDSQDQSSSTKADLNGYWFLRDNLGNQSTLYFTHQGSQFEFVEYNILNLQIGQGKGEIKGSQLQSEYYNSLLDVAGSISMSSEDNGQTFSGYVSIPSTNGRSEIRLTRN